MNQKELEAVAIKAIDACHLPRASIAMADFVLLVGAALKHDEISIDKACELLGMHRAAVVSAFQSRAGWSDDGCRTYLLAAGADSGRGENDV